jgi:transposase
LALDDRWWPTVARLRSFRGVDTLTALALHLELGGNWQRFERAPQLAAWLGLTPSLTQSGESSRQGSITKTGSTLARRLLVEAAWHYSREPRIGATLQTASKASPTTCCRSPRAPNSASTASTGACAHAASRVTSASWPAHASCPASSGPR